MQRAWHMAWHTESGQRRGLVARDAEWAVIRIGGTEPWGRIRMCIHVWIS